MYQQFDISLLITKSSRQIQFIDSIFFCRRLFRLLLCLLSIVLVVYRRCFHVNYMCVHFNSLNVLNVLNYLNELCRLYVYTIEHLRRSYPIIKSSRHSNETISAFFISRFFFHFTQSHFIPY